VTSEGADPAGATSVSPPTKAPAAAAKAAAPRGEIIDRVAVHEIDRVAALVDGDVITLSEINERAAGDLRRAELLSGTERNEARGKALHRALEAVISDRLLQKQAKALGLEVSEGQVDAAIADIKTRNHFDDEGLERALAEQGLDRATFRGQIKRELETYSVMQAKARGRAKITDDDLKNYYQSHPQEFEGETELHVRHIFLPLPESAPPPEVAKAREGGERVLQRLRTGEDFAAVARGVSKGPSASDGGDIGWLRRGTVQRELEDAAFALKDGQFSGLVRAGAGIHILKVEARRVGGAKTFEQAKEEIRNHLLEEQVGQTRQEVLDELRKSAVVEIKDPELRG
jgi:peptidyl-prolyl cis-trans isomerase SurA